MATAFSMMKTESTATSGLPVPFLDAMRKLFDIMDCDEVGWIHIDGTYRSSPTRHTLALSLTALTEQYENV